MILTEEQVAALEKAKTEKEAHGEFESECPGLRNIDFPEVTAADRFTFVEAMVEPHVRRDVAAGRLDLVAPLRRCGDERARQIASGSLVGRLKLRPPIPARRRPTPTESLEVDRRRKGDGVRLPSARHLDTEAQKFTK